MRGKTRAKSALIREGCRLRAHHIERFPNAPPPTDVRYTVTLSPRCRARIAPASSVASNVARRIAVANGAQSADFVDLAYATGTAEENTCGHSSSSSMYTQS